MLLEGGGECVPLPIKSYEWLTCNLCPQYEYIMHQAGDENRLNYQPEARPWHDMPFDWFLLVDRCSADITFNNFLLFSHTNQINSMLLWVCTVMDHRNCQNAVRTSVGCTLCASFMLLLHFDLICDLLLLNRHTATWNSSVNQNCGSWWWVMGLTSW